jgi:hypothetical protein
VLDVVRWSWLWLGASVPIAGFLVALVGLFSGGPGFPFLVSWGWLLWLAWGVAGGLVVKARWGGERARSFALGGFGLAFAVNLLLFSLCAIVVVRGVGSA